jgi:hypothetical protein
MMIDGEKQSSPAYQRRKYINFIISNKDDEKS